MRPEERPFAHKFTVSSKATCLVSPVWKAMLNGKFKEGASSREVRLPEDNARALEYVLNLVHFKFGRLWTPTFSELKDIAVVCDKYDMAGLCRYQVFGRQTCRFGSSECVAYNVGSIATTLNRNLIRIDMTTERATSGRDRTLHWLADLVEAMEIPKLNIPDQRQNAFAMKHDVHKACRSLSGLKNKVGMIMDGLPSALKEHHKTHLETQAKKVGTVGAM